MRVALRKGVLLAAYVGLSLLWWHPLLTHFATRTLGGGQSDPGLFVWWLRWTPHALGHGENPLATTYLQAPGGVSAVWNTSVLALGVLLAPVTQLAGPVASYNLILILGPALSAFTCALWLRRHAGAVGAAIGGTVFGFSPMVVAASLGHVMITWLALVPLILMLAEDVLWRASRPSRVRAPLLGVLVALQFFVSPEVLTLTALFVATGTVLVAASDRQRARARLRLAVPAVATVVVVAGVLLAPALVNLASGRYRISEPVQTLGYVGTPTLLVHASRLFVVSGASHPVGDQLLVVENGLFVGWPLLLLLGIVVVALRRRRDVRIAAVLLAILLLCELKHLSPLLLAERHLPVVHDIVTSRVALLFWLVVGYLLAVAVDHVVRQWGPGRRVAAVAVVVACLVPLLPRPPSARVDGLGPIPATPAWFRGPVTREVPAGTVVMIAPMAGLDDSSAETWQVAAHLRFRLVGGYALRKAGAGSSLAPPQTALTALFAASSAARDAAPPDAARLATARRELAASGAQVFVVVAVAGVGPVLLARATTLLGRPPDRVEGGVDVWDVARS